MTHDIPPKRIWATEDTKNFGEDRCHSTRPFKSGHEYILASEAEAMVAAALREAAELVADDHVSDAILNLADNHAAAALDKLIAEAEARGMERAETHIAAIERLAISASIASCTCLTKTPDITFHAADCRYVYLQYIIAQCEDFRAPNGDPT